jgi:hypothetical protein
VQNEESKNLPATLGDFNREIPLLLLSLAQRFDDYLEFLV